MSTRAPVVVVAPDSFKGSVSAAQAASAIARGVREILPKAEVVELPLADGGEGTLDAILGIWGERPRTVEAVDAIGRPRTARYGLSADAATAVIEAAEGNGLPHVSDVPLQPRRADSYGVGLIAGAVLDAGVKEILLCIGGSASTDGGTGLLSALGVRFLDEGGNPVAPGGAGLTDIRSVDASELHPRAKQVYWRVAVDVDNPLVGPRGAAATFGPQKGAQPEDVAALDAGLENLARVLAQANAARVDDYVAGEGFGAAGGLPLTLVALLGAELTSGASLVGDAVGLSAALARADVVITGEGCLDRQSLGGKVVDAVRQQTPAAVPVVVIAGRVDLTPAECRDAGITAALSIARGAATLQELIADTDTLLADAAAHALALLSFDRSHPRRLGK